MVTVLVELSLVERFYGDGKHRRYVATGRW
jgi:hypothetical protein